MICSLIWSSSISIMLIVRSLLIITDLPLPSHITGLIRCSSASSCFLISGVLSRSIKSKSFANVELPPKTAFLIFSVTSFVSFRAFGNGVLSTFLARRILVETTMSELLFLYQIMTFSPHFLFHESVYEVLRLFRNPHF